MPGGPALIAFDGSPGADEAIRDAAALLSVPSALVVVVYKQGLAFELMALPAAALELPPAGLDIATALETEERMYTGAQRLAEQGAGIAREAGFAEADSLVVADDPDTPIGETLAETARRRDAAVLVVAPHTHGGVAGRFLGSTTRDVLRHASCPVLARPITSTDADR